MGFALTDILLFGKTTEDTVDNGTLRIYRRNIMRWRTVGQYITVIVRGISPLSLPDAVADSLQYVKAFGGVEQRNVPEGYAELEYIEGTSNVQYINTNIVPNSSMEISAKVQLMSDAETTSTFFFGGRTQSTGGTGVAGMWSPSELIFDWFGTSSSDRYSVSATRTVGDILEYSVNNSLVTIKRNGTVAGTHQFTPTGTSTQPLYVNGMNNGGSIISNNSAKARVYRFTIAGICDFVPAKRLSDNAIGMWDKIRKQFFTNAGTGAFTAGAEVTTPSPTLPRDIWCNNGAIKAIRPIEYLESTGTQYIDTGIVGNLNTEYEITVKSNAIPSAGGTASYAIFGSRTSATENNIMSTYTLSTGGLGIINDFGDYNTTRQIPTISATNMLHRYTITNSKSERTITDLDTGWTETVTTTYSGSLTTPTNLYIGYAGSLGGLANVANLRGNIYGCKIWKSGTLVRDFIPVLDSYSIPCMYDKVEGKCYYNQGTGQFIAPYLPAEYERLDYIESTGTQYIDTGIARLLTNSYRIEAGITYSDTTTRQLNGVGGYTYFGVVNGYYQVSRQGTEHQNIPAISNTMSTFELDFDCPNNKMRYSINGGTQTEENVSYINNPENGNFWLFALGNTGGYKCTQKLYYFNLYQNNVLVCDMIPARRISDGEIGMYDVIRRQFFTNAGTGSFTAGEYSVLPDGYTQYDYIESTGTQYIDTGVVCGSSTNVFKTETRIAWTAKKTLLDTNPFFIGAFDNNNDIRKFLRTGLINNNFTYTVSSSASHDNTSNVTPTLNTIYDTTFTYGKGDTVSLVINQDGTNILNSSETGDWVLPNTSVFLFGYNNINDNYRLALCRIYASKIYLDGTLVRDFIPAKRNSDNVVGMYDTVNDVFYTNAGTGVFGTGSVVPPYTPEQPQIMVDGTVEKIKIDTDAEVATCENLFATQTLKDEQEILSGDIVRNVGIAVLTGQENWTTESTWFKANVFTGNSMDNAIVCSHFERGTITQDNTVARSAGTTVMMLHYSACANVAALKSWLASQYNAGTPVIVLYALETAETESVAGQTLNVVEGDNYAEIMQASIDDLMLEAKYMKSA